METKIKKTFEVTQVIPSTTFVTYQVEAYDEEEAQRLVDEQDESIDLIGEHIQDLDWKSIEYDVNEI